MGTPPGNITLASDFAVDDVGDHTCVRVNDFVWSRLLDMQGLGLADPYGSAFAANELVDEARGRADGLTGDFASFATAGAAEAWVRRVQQWIANLRRDLLQESDRMRMTILVCRIQYVHGKG